MASHTTRQEDFWAGDFGRDYAARNRGDALVASNLALFERVLSHTEGVRSVLELGCNIGNNLRALRTLLPHASLRGVEINAEAAAEVRAWGGAEVEVASILGYAAREQVDLAFTKGVLIHIDPDHVAQVYASLTAASSRYVMVCEYYNPTPVEVPYRGHDRALFKRDFAGEILDSTPGLRLVDYAFTYHRDPVHPLDDLTWFLMERTDTGSAGGAG